MLRERFDVDLGTDWSRDDLLERIGNYHGILIRSATKLDAEVIERADNLRVVGRAASAWTTSTSPPPPSAASSSPTRRRPTRSPPRSTPSRRARARPQHPQAHAPSRAASGSGEVRRDRGRGQDARRARLRPHRQPVAIRARAFGMRVVAYDPFVSPERFREIGEPVYDQFVRRGRAQRREAEDGRGRGLRLRRAHRRRPGRRHRTTRTRSGGGRAPRR